MGPMTGRGIGWCRGGGWGRGNGWGRGYRGGWRNQQYPMPPVAPVVPTITREQELNALKQQFEYLETSLNEVKRMIQEMESAKDEES